MQKAISRVAGRWLCLAAMVWAQQAWACDVAQPKCVAVNQLLEKLQYRDKLLEAQRGCSVNANERSPEALAKKGVMRLLGMKKGDPGWSDAEEAHEKFVGAACGGEEVVQVVLNIYRNEWLREASEGELTKMTEAGAAIDAAKRSKVAEAARAMAATVLNAMQDRAGEEYEEEIKKLTGAHAQGSSACPGGEMDERTQTCKTRK